MIELGIQSDIIKMLSKICCFNTDFCKCQWLGLTRNKNIKFGYVLILLIAQLALCLLDSVVQPSQSTNISYACVQAQNPQFRGKCIADKNALIVFGGVAIMHLMVLCCMFCKSQKIKVINEGLWLVKLLVAAFWALMIRLLIGTASFRYLDYFSIWGSNLLFLFEAIVFVDLVYALDINLDKCAQQNSKIYILKAIISITLLIASAFICFISFKHNNQVICWINAVSLIIFFIVAILRVFPGNSILVVGFISLCINILGFYIEIDNHDDEQFNSALVILKALFVLFLLMGMLCQGSNKLRTRKSTLNQLLALNTTSSEEDNRYVSSNKWTVYHYVMMIIVVTIPAALSWGNRSTHPEVKEWIDIANVTWWASTILLYIWSLICSILFPERDFSDLQNYFREYELQ